MTDDPLEPAARACLDRTRAAVLNALVAVGVGIALSGLLIRWRDGWAIGRAPETVGRGLMASLVGVLVLSFAVRRVWGGRLALGPGPTRCARFYRAHVASAAVGALAVPLGLAYGWFVRPRLDAVLPFWVAGLALGVLAFPRAGSLEGFDEPWPEGAGAHGPTDDGPTT